MVEKPFLGVMMKKDRHDWSFRSDILTVFHNQCCEICARNPEHIYIWGQILKMLKDRQQIDRYIFLSSISSVSGENFVILSLVILKLYWHLIWRTKCWQESFSVWHQSPQMSAMMTLNFVKWDPPSSSFLLSAFCTTYNPLHAQQMAVLLSWSSSVSLRACRLSFGLFRV